MVTMADNKGLHMGAGLTQDWLPVSGDSDDSIEPGEVARITIDIPKDDAAFLRQLALYRNAKAKAGGRRFPRQFSAKSLAESFIIAACKVQRQAIKEVTDALGELPDDRDEMSRYAEKAHKLETKNSK